MLTALHSKRIEPGDLAQGGVLRQAGLLRRLQRGLRVKGRLHDGAATRPQPRLAAAQQQLHAQALLQIAGTCLDLYKPSRALPALIRISAVHCFPALQHYPLSKAYH